MNTKDNMNNLEDQEEPKATPEEQKAEEIAREIRSRDTWDNDLNRALCDLAGLANEYDQADGDTFESVVNKAAELLQVAI